ncbi:MAG: cbb3-type cytochrome oxidase assembly protein CcoS [Verrucomicrobiales bacterium]
MMDFIYILIVVFTLLMGASVVVALSWAGSTGQFRDMRRNSEVIFDQDEPVGKRTDMVLPKKEKKQKSRPTN